MAKRKKCKPVEIDVEGFRESIRKSWTELSRRLNEKDRLPCGCIVYKHSGRIVTMCYEHAHRRIGARAA